MNDAFFPIGKLFQLPDSYTSTMESMSCHVMVALYSNTFGACLTYLAAGGGVASPFIQDGRPAMVGTDKDKQREINVFINSWDEIVPLSHNKLLLWFQS